jgi:hypothetical protein
MPKTERTRGSQVQSCYVFTFRTIVLCTIKLCRGFVQMWTTVVWDHGHLLAT